MRSTFNEDLLEDNVLICTDQERESPEVNDCTVWCHKDQLTCLIFLTVFLSLQANQRRAATEGIKSDTRMAEQNYRHNLMFSTQHNVLLTINYINW